MYLGIRFRAIESRQEASAVVPRRGDLSRFEGRDGGNRGRFSWYTYLPRRKRSTDGERFSLIGCDRSRRVSPLLSSQFLYLLHSALSLSLVFLVFLPFLSVSSSLYSTITVSIVQFAPRSFFRVNAILPRPNHVFPHIVAEQC